MTRSKAYPGVSLSQCVENLQRVRKSLGRGPYDRAGIGEALGLSSNTVIRAAAAMAHFGLLDKTGEGYVLSELGQVISAPLADEELKKALVSALYSPTLYRTVLSEYETTGHLPHRLGTVLHRHHGISDNAAELAAKVLIESSKYAGVIDDTLQFVGSQSDDRRSVPAPTLPVPEVEMDEQYGSSSSAAPSDYETGSDADDIQQDFRFRLSGGKFARLTVPAVINRRDIEIIRKQIEILDLQVEVE